MEPESSLPCSLELVIGSCPEPDEYSSHLLTSFLFTDPI
jgi:hypothetical protein